MTALPSIAHLPCAAWWRAARVLVGRARTVNPTRLQKERLARRRLERLTPMIVASYLAGVLISDLWRIHEMSSKEMKRLINAHTTEMDRRRIYLWHHSRRQRTTTENRKARDYREQTLTEFSLKERADYLRAFGRPVKMVHAPCGAWGLVRKAEA